MQLEAKIINNQIKTSTFSSSIIISGLCMVHCICSCMSTHVLEDFPDLGGPTMAILMGTAGPGGGCSMNR